MDLLIRTVLFFLEILYWLIIARVIVSFLPLQNIKDPWRQILRFLFDVTEPILSPIRNLLPRSRMGLDFSPFIAILLLILIRQLILSALLG